MTKEDFIYLQKRLNSLTADRRVLERRYLNDFEDDYMQLMRYRDGQIRGIEKGLSLIVNNWIDEDDYKELSQLFYDYKELEKRATYDVHTSKPFYSAEKYNEMVDLWRWYSGVADGLLAVLYTAFDFEYDEDEEANN